MRLLYIIADPFPTHRPDVAVLFGKYLHDKGVESDVVAEASENGVSSADWRAGKAFLCPRTGGRVRNKLGAFIHDARVLLRVRRDQYDAIMVRDKVFSAVVALMAAKRLGMPFFYWMSFPLSEAFIEIARSCGLSIGLPRYLYLLAKGYVGKWLLYRLVLPNSKHIFVQSERMREDVAAHGIPNERMTSVPMGVDTDRRTEGDVPDNMKERLTRGPVIAYLGTFDRLRQLDFLLDVLKKLLAGHPNLTLLMVGGADAADDEEALKRYAMDIGVAGHVVWTGWVSSDDAWRYMKYAAVALSVVPRGKIFDCSSPTKVVEYLALGIPTVANDLPDQERVLQGSGAGISVPLEVNAFAEAVARILDNPALAESMRRMGPEWVRKNRSYSQIVNTVFTAIAGSRTLSEHGGAVREPSI